MDPKILVIGACGQIGSELTLKLKALYGNENVIASDIRDSNLEVVNSGVFEILDAQDFNSLSACIKKHEINTVYLMAAMLSATSEKSPMKAWDLNMNSLFHVLNLAKDKVIQKVFWPSSIAVFGPLLPPKTPRNTPLQNLQPFMVLRNWLASVGANITTKNTVSMLEVCATLVLLAGKPCRVVAQPTML